MTDLGIADLGLWADGFGMLYGLVGGVLIDLHLRAGIDTRDEAPSSRLSSEAALKLVRFGASRLVASDQILQKYSFDPINVLGLLLAKILCSCVNDSIYVRSTHTLHLGNQYV